MVTKKTPRAAKKTAGARKRQTVGESIIEGLRGGDRVDARRAIVDVRVHAGPGARGGRAMEPPSGIEPETC
jgi:hypothetical protein